MLPEGWKTAQLQECANFVSGGTPSKEREDYWQGDFPWVTAKDMKTLWLKDSLLKLSASGKAASTVVPRGSVLVLTRGMTLLKDLPVGVTERDMSFNQDIKALLPLDGMDANFLAFQLLAHKNDILELVDTAGHGTGRLDTEQLKQLALRVPPRAEQRAIADVLCTWESAVATTERLLLNSRRQKEALSSALLSGRRRLVPSAKWHRKPLAELISESRLAGTTGDVARKLTVKLYGKGVIAKSERRQGSESTSYYRRCAGQFIYSKLDFLNGAFGLIPEHLDGYESTLDLPAFDIRDGIDPRWFLYYVSREEFYQGHLGLANGGRKARRVNPADLLKVSIDCPPQIEQRAIADAIEAAWADERKWQAMSSLLRAEKAALMADLLSGRRRTLTNTEAPRDCADLAVL